jgi:hypothetical protein
MTFVSNLSDPTNLDSLRGFLKAEDKDSRLQALDMLRVEISESAHLKLGEAVAEALATTGKKGTASIIVLADISPIMRAD